MEFQSANFQYEREMPWEPAGEGVTRQIMGYNDNMMMVKVKFEKERQALRTHILTHKRPM